MQWEHALKEKHINLVCSSCLKHAGWSTASWLANAKLQLLHGHSSISWSLRSRAKLLVFTCSSCVNQSSTVRFLAPTSAREHLTTCIYRSGSDSERDASTCGRGDQNPRSWFESVSIDVTSVSLSLSLYHYYSQKSLTHNIPGAEAPGII